MTGDRYPKTTQTAPQAHLTTTERTATTAATSKELTEKTETVTKWEELPLDEFITSSTSLKSVKKDDTEVKKE